MCPGVPIERHYLYPCDLAEHSGRPRSVPPCRLVSGLLDHGPSCPLSATCPSPQQLVCFSCPALSDRVRWPADLPVSALPAATRRLLCAALDPADRLGRDWCLLAVRLGLTDRLAGLDAGDNPAVSRTGRLLQLVGRLSLGRLHAALRQIGRVDVADRLAAATPVYRLRLGSGRGRTDGVARPCSESAASSSTVSR